MTDWGFGQAIWLWLLPLPLLLYRLRRSARSHWPQLQPEIALRFPQLQILKQDRFARDTRSHRRTSERLLLCALILFVVALAQPLRYGDTLPTSSTEPVDLVLLVDTNITMVIEDYSFADEPVSRMQMTRQLLADFVTTFTGSRMGLSIMGDPPLHWLPLTDDRDAVQNAVSRLRPALAGRLSDMSASLQLVTERYLNSIEASSIDARREPTQPVVVMVTDSSLQFGAISPEEAAAALSASGAHLYVIAMGSTTESDTLTTGRESSFVYEPVDLKLLEKVAAAGKGKLFHATDAKAFREALQFIETTHRTSENREPQIRLVRALYPIPLALGALLLLASLMGSGFSSRLGPRQKS